MAGPAASPAIKVQLFCISVAVTKYVDKSMSFENQNERVHMERNASPSLIAYIRSALQEHACTYWDVTSLKNYESHIDASLSRQPLVKGERLVRTEMNAVITDNALLTCYDHGHSTMALCNCRHMETKRRCDTEGKWQRAYGE